DLDDVSEGVAADDEVGQRAREVFRRGPPDEGAAAGPGLDDAEQLERSQRLADRRPRNLELLRERALGRELITRTELSLVEERFDLAHDVLIEPATSDGLDDSQSRPPQRNWSGGLTRTGKPYQRAGKRSSVAGYGVWLRGRGLGVPRHEQAETLLGGLGGGQCGDEPALEHDRDPVRERPDLVELARDQEHRGA